MAETTVHVKGLREAQRAFKRLDVDAAADLKAELVALAEPVALEARERLARYAGIKLGTIKAKSRMGVAVAQQGARKVTGRRPDFGALQMTEGFLPAAAHQAPLVQAGVERLLDHLIAKDF